jgi:hypothetical protein
MNGKLTMKCKVIVNIWNYSWSSSNTFWINWFIADANTRIIHRFEVKSEVTDGQATGVFVLFDSDMS